jgi:hypothetical protein
VAAALTLGAPAQAQTHASPPALPTPAGSPTNPVPAVADPPAPNAPVAPGTAALERARAAWEKGDFDVAEPLYREAIETGGLAPADVLEAYVHLGASRAVLGKKPGALSAFKTAALIDPHFVVPPEAGKRAVLAATRARAQVARIGKLSLQADIPSELSTGESAQIDATFDAGHSGFAAKIALFVRDPLSGKTYGDTQDATTSVHFKVPSSFALPSATLLLRVDALDEHQNRLASVEGKSRVRAALPAPAVALFGAAGGAGAGALVSPNLLATGGPKDSGKETKKGGFWSTAWPYVIGGAALAAGGAAIYFATRSTDDVNVGAVRVDLTR